MIESNDMFKNNAILFWKFKNKLIPDIIEFIGAFPKDNPVNYIYKLTKDDFSSYVAVQMSNSGLMTREIYDQDEIDYLYNNSDESRNSTRRNKE